MTAKEVLIEIKKVAEYDLNYFYTYNEVDTTIEPLKMIYIEILEIMQQWDGAKAIGLDYDIENRYPLI